MEYTLGFVFDRAQERVLLIHKRTPAWQAGRINGLGGVLEAGETPVAGIRREVWEESGLDIAERDWLPVATMQAGDWTVHVFAALYAGDPAAAYSRTAEPVGWYSVNMLPDAILSNLAWLIPLGLDRLRHGTPRRCVAWY